MLLTWNAGACCGFAAAHGVDDVGFTIALLEALARRVPLDATRVYASGMYVRLHVRVPPGARRLVDCIAGIATIAGAARTIPFAPKRPMPIVHFHSTDDPRALYAGRPGPAVSLPHPRRAWPPVERVLDDWAVANGGPKHPLTVETRTAAPGTPDAGQTATLLRYGPCTSGAPIDLWKLTGAGHVWPGAAPLRVGQSLLGRPTSLVDASAILWDTLARHRRPDAPALPRVETE